MKEAWFFSATRARHCSASFATPNHLNCQPQFKRLQLGGRWTTEPTQAVNFIAGCEFHSSGRAHHVWEQKTLPVQHVSPALLRSQEALNILEFSIFVNRYLGGNLPHASVPAITHLLGKAGSPAQGQEARQACWRELEFRLLQCKLCLAVDCSKDKPAVHVNSGLQS